MAGGALGMAGGALGAAAGFCCEAAEPGATRWVGGMLGLRTGVTGICGRENSGLGFSCCGTGTPKAGRTGSGGSGWRGPVRAGEPGSRMDGALGTGAAGCEITGRTGGADGTGRDGMEMERFTGPGVAGGVDGDDSGG